MKLRRFSRLAGLLQIATGVFVLTFPVWTGSWVVALLGLPVAVAGARKLLESFRTGLASPSPWTGYAEGALLCVAGILLFVSPGLATNGLATLLSAYALAFAVVRTIRLTRTGGRKIFLNDTLAILAAILVAFAIWRLRNENGLVVAGIAAGLTLIAAGWDEVFNPAPGVPAIAGSADPSRHMDSKLALEPHSHFEELCRRLSTNNPLRSRDTVRWLSFFILSLFFIHGARMEASLSPAGLAPTLVATLGDTLIAISAFWFLMLPVRLLWRKLTRVVERRLWRERFAAPPATSPLLKAASYMAGTWLDGRYHFAFQLHRARVSLLDGISMALGNGLIVASLLVAINSIWGFSWYFNTENWASGIYQAVAGPRTDLWRKAMAEAVLAKSGAGLENAFSVVPNGIESNRDFSFLVIGDPGEGDASQAALKDRVVELANRDDTAFIVISSDVIYPAGEMKDYEQNYYLPFKGVRKPIYAIPGNHDWFNGLAAFAANFMTPTAALTSIKARSDADHGLTLMSERQRIALIERAKELRAIYGLQSGLQSAPYFDIQTPSFALIAVDTGILRSIDDTQLKWLEAALTRARGKFIMALTGHPRYAGGSDTAADDENFRRLFDLFDKSGVAVAMAGDTHDFEYYRATPTSPLHVLNGGGGAYLSIGTALNWPSSPPVEQWGYYPSTASLRKKLARETPIWQRPALAWINWFNAWPATVETLSGIFNFNHAPFFQSFIEVQVSPARSEVRLSLYGVDGLLHWSDLDHSSVLPADLAPGDPVTFILPMPHSGG